MKLVLCVWEDASRMDEDTWAVRADAPAPKPIIFHQVGWLHSMDVDAVCLTSAVSEHLMAPRDRIPMGMVKTIVELDPASGVPLKKKRTR